MAPADKMPGPAGAGQEIGAEFDRAPHVVSTVTVFYYPEIAPSLAFYRSTLGLEVVLSRDWVAILRIRTGSFLALVEGNRGSQHPIAGRNRGAIVSIETDRLASWHNHLHSMSADIELSDIRRGCGGLMDEFQLRDPGGYTIEFFTWLVPPSTW